MPSFFIERFLMLSMFRCPLLFTGFAMRVPGFLRARAEARSLLNAGLLVFAISIGIADPSSADDSFERAKAAALKYFATQVSKPDPGWLGVIGYLHRRFGLDVRLTSGARAHEVTQGVVRPEIYAVYRRLNDPLATVSKQQIADLPTAIDRITASALHCDRIIVPDNWIEILHKAAAAGGYALTHSALAAQWTVENGCRSKAEVASLQAEQIRLLSDLIVRRHQLASQFDAITDIWLEAVGLLYYLGAKERVQSDWIGEMLVTQRPDGGWTRHPRATKSDPHATVLAMWVLLENLQPSAPAIAWIPR